MRELHPIEADRCRPFYIVAIVAVVSFRCPEDLGDIRT
jgi:hypothetical protein